MGNAYVLGAGTVTSVNGVTGPVQIGGRNYVSHSSPTLHPTGWHTFRSFSEEVKVENGYAVSNKWSGDYLSIVTPYASIGTIEPGTYTFSFDVYASVPIQDRIGGWVLDAAWQTLDLKLYDFCPLDNVLIPSFPGKRFQRTLELTKPYDKGGVAFLFYNAAHPEVTIYIKDIQLERGNVATDWKPAPGDVESRLEAIEAKLGITYDPPMVDGPEMEDMEMDNMTHAGGV